MQDYHIIQKYHKDSLKITFLYFYIFILMGSKVIGQSDDKQFHGLFPLYLMTEVVWNSFQVLNLNLAAVHVNFLYAL